MVTKKETRDWKKKVKSAPRWKFWLARILGKRVAVSYCGTTAVFYHWRDKVWIWSVKYEAKGGAE